MNNELLDDFLQTTHYRGTKGDWRDLPDDDKYYEDDAPYLGAIIRNHAAERDYKEIEKLLDARELEAARLLLPGLLEMRDELVEYAGRAYRNIPDDPSWVKTLGVDVPKGLEAAIDAMLRDAFDLGRDTSAVLFKPKEYAAGDISRFPEEGLRYFKERGLYISGILSKDLTADAQAVLLQSMQIGAPVNETVAKLQKLFDPLVGKDWDIADWEQSKPHRLATIVRTNTTDAYNHGVLTEMRSSEYDGMVKAFEYMAILDSRTTPICRHLDGKVFRRDDKRLDRLVPPNHYNCRSIIEPVLYGRRLRAGELITPAAYRKALSLLPTGFGGEP
jgi:SPP1 gp7 family putative phage head morphogenesis protein